MSIEIDSTNPGRQPTNFAWSPPVEIGTDHNGAPIWSLYRTCQLSWQYMELTDFDNWTGYVDGAAHSVTIPHPFTNSPTTYNNVYVHLRGGTREFFMNGITLEFTHVAVT